jgi:hypothetical protein
MIKARQPQLDASPSRRKFKSLAWTSFLRGADSGKNGLDLAGGGLGLIQKGYFAITKKRHLLRP